MHGVGKYMKFSMYEKKSKENRYRDNPCRTCNFDIDHVEYMVCPNGMQFHFLRSSPINGKQFNRTEEYCQCECWTDFPHREKCHKSEKNRVVRVNKELTSFHSEVLSNLNCVHDDESEDSGRRHFGRDKME